LIPPRAPAHKYIKRNGTKTHRVTTLLSMDPPGLLWTPAPQHVCGGSNGVRSAPAPRRRVCDGELCGRPGTTSEHLGSVAVQPCHRPCSPRHVHLALIRGHGSRVGHGVWGGAASSLVSAFERLRSKRVMHQAAHGVTNGDTYECAHHRSAHRCAERSPHHRVANASTHGRANHRPPHSRANTGAHSGSTVLLWAVRCIHRD
jgi:hypothetical protein